MTLSRSKVKVTTQSSLSQDENAPKVISVTLSDGFLAISAQILKHI